jgi:hypothetical protein
MKVYLPGGRIVRESCRTDRVGEARRLLDLRRARATGTAIIPRADRVTVNELLDELVTEYTVNQRRSLGVHARRWPADQELPQELADRVPAGGGARADPARLPADGRPEPRAGRGAALGGHWR